MACKIVILLPTVLLLAALTLAAPAEKQLRAEAREDQVASEKDDLQPAASHWGGGYGGYWGGYGGYGGYGGHLGYPFHGYGYGYPSYYGYGYGWPYGGYYGGHGYWY